VAVTDDLVNLVEAVVTKYVYRSKTLPNPSICHTGSRSLRHAEHDDLVKRITHYLQTMVLGRSTPLP
jgi:hypothetical protein